VYDSVTFVGTSLKTYRIEKGGERVELRGLLSEFLREKARTYVQPTRAGTPKGEPVGLSELKYAATLLALTSEDVKKQAQILGVSYGVLRKWRTESPFEKQVNAHAKEFIERFFRRIRERLASHDEETDLLLQLPLDQLVNTKILGRQNYAEFDDGETYSDWLFDELFKRYLKIKRKPDSLGEVRFESEVLWVFDWIARLKGKATPFMDLARTQMLPTLRGLLKKSLEILTSEKPTAEQHQFAIVSLIMATQGLEKLEGEDDLASKRKN
jgi:hypothetical protein